MKEHLINPNDLERHYFIKLEDDKEMEFCTELHCFEEINFSKIINNDTIVLESGIRLQYVKDIIEIEEHSPDGMTINVIRKHFKR